jgi:5-methylcytosine-specific restriction endonuclease McrA
MQGNPPENLEPVDPKSRHYPASWRDAAIRASFDIDQRGVLCSGCGKIFRGRRELGLLQSDHIHPWSQEGLTTWENLQLLCRPCNLLKSDNLS